MLNLLGEHIVKVDNKGRMLFPSKLRKQLEEVIHHGLVLNRDIYSKCLVLYPKPEWDRIQEDFSKLNRYNRNHLEFQRRFLNGATVLELDNAGRLSLPANMLDYADIDLKKNNELVIVGALEKMEIWSAANHKQMVEDNQNDFAALAEQVQRDLGSLNQ
ncbi:MAG: division/cell wall cluster transcriptional repressor MraZ [Flavobacteriales bacterium]